MALETVTITGKSPFANPLTVPLSTIIDTNGKQIRVHASVEETHSHRLEVTEHPVESGASITDHSFKRPAEVVLRCGWSNSRPDVTENIVSSFIQGGTTSAYDFVRGIYSQLLNLQDSRALFSIDTSQLHYDNLLMTSLVVRSDERTPQALMVEMTCRQVILVSTQSTTLPPQANQANPASTAEVQDTGAQTLQPPDSTVRPREAGSVPPSAWGTSLGIR